MFKVMVFFISLTTAEIDSTIQSQGDYTKERCEFILAHDLPILKERAEAVFPGQYELQGLCMQEPGQEM